MVSIAIGFIACVLSQEGQLDAAAIESALKTASTAVSRGEAVWEHEAIPPAGSAFPATFVERVKWDGPRTRVESEPVTRSDAPPPELLISRGTISIRTPNIWMLQHRQVYDNDPVTEQFFVEIYEGSPEDYSYPAVKGGILPGPVRTRPLAVELREGNVVVLKGEEAGNKPCRFACRSDRGYTLDWYESAEGQGNTTRYEMRDYRQVYGVWWPFYVERLSLRPDGTVSHRGISRLKELKLGGDPHPESDYQLAITEKGHVIDRRTQAPPDQEVNEVVAP